MSFFRRRSVFPCFAAAAVFAAALPAQDMNHPEEIDTMLDQMEQQLENPEGFIFPTQDTTGGNRDDGIDTSPNKSNVDKRPEDRVRPENVVQPGYVRLDVPLVEQQLGPVCGPASMEMVLRYYGEYRHDQYEIARALTMKFATEKRYRRFAEDIGRKDPRVIPWKEYPGTGTYYMRAFLEGLGLSVENKRIKRLPADPYEARVKREEFFENLVRNLHEERPVIVHQYFKKKSSSMHYRVVTGYDLKKQRVYLNDPKLGRIEQPFSDFFELWNVKEEWLQYNSIVVKATKGLQVKL